MRIRTIFTAVVLALGLGLATAPGAGAAPTAAPAKHCVYDVTRAAVACVATQGDLDRLLTERRLVNVIRIWTGYNQSGTALGVATSGCSVGWTTLPSWLYQNASSVGYNAASGCKWQLLGAAGANSPWVASQWDNLTTLGTGWDDRAVAYRLG